MKILVTGAKGFIGRNLIVGLKNQIVEEVFQYDIDSQPSSLDDYCNQAGFVFHLAGVNRPKDHEEFREVNFGFTSTLLESLKKHDNRCPVMISSSTQAALDNPYGISKKAGEDLMFEYAKETGVKVLVYRFPNIFGKWCKPNYNSAVATFCNNIANDLPITVNDSNNFIKLVYIDDVIEEMINALYGKENRREKFCEVPLEYEMTLGEIVNLLKNYKAIETGTAPPIFKDEFERKLFATYLSYLPSDNPYMESFIKTEPVSLEVKK